MANTLVRLTAEIVGAYVSNNPVPAADLPTLIADAHSALTRLIPTVEPAVKKPVPPVTKIIGFT